MEITHETAALDLSSIDPERRAAVAHDHIVKALHHHRHQYRRAPALTAREALIAVQFECMLVWTALGNFIHGVELTDADFERLTLAMRRIDSIVNEVAS